MRYEIIHLKDVFPTLGKSGCDPTVTAYLPDNLTEMKRGEQRHPCLVICPGGGYQGCSQREAEPIALHFLPYGFHVFVLTYSTAPNAYPTQVREVAGAMELIRQRANDWKSNPSRIALMGFSSGGHLAAHYATSWDSPAIRAVFPESLPVQASVLCYPVITADAPWAHFGSFRVLSGKKEPAQEEIDRFSCEKLVRGDTPPAFLWHTSEDSGVPAMNSLLYAQALAAHHIPFELHIYPFGAHGLATSDAITNRPDELGPDEQYDRTWLYAAGKWLQRMLLDE